MLCNVKEGGREKCANYWDEKENNNLMKNYIIKLKKEDKKNNYILREIKLVNQNTKNEKNIVQVHFIGWPDHGIPDTSDGKIFEIFEEIIYFTYNHRENSPIIVHCSAGVGRTGTFISMYFIEKEIKKQIEEKKGIIKFNIFNLVRKLKEMRLYLVQSSSQYNFVYLYANYLLNKYNI